MQRLFKGLFQSLEYNDNISSLVETFRQKYPTLFKIEFCEKIFDFRGQKKFFFEVWVKKKENQKISERKKTTKNHK